MTSLLALCALAGAAGGLWRAFRATRPLIALGERLRLARADEVHAGRACWGKPTADGIERLYLEVGGRRMGVVLQGADALAVRPSRERLFEPETHLVVIAPRQEVGEGGETTLCGEGERRLVVTNLSRLDAGRWIDSVLRRTRPAAVACALIVLLALAAAIAIGHGLVG